MNQFNLFCLPDISITDLRSETNKLIQYLVYYFITDFNSVSNKYINNNVYLLFFLLKLISDKEYCIIVFVICYFVIFFLILNQLSLFHD